jgi:hypothetical protein
MAAMVLGLVSHVLGDVRQMRLTDTEGRVTVLPAELGLTGSGLIQPLRGAGFNGTDDVRHGDRGRQPNEQVCMIVDRIDF